MPTVLSRQFAGERTAFAIAFPAARREALTN